MKKTLGLLFIICAIFSFNALRVRAEDRAGTQYVLREVGGGYTLAVDENGYEKDVLITDSFCEVLEYAAVTPRSCITALNVTVREDVTFFAQDLTLSGELTIARDSSFSVLGGRITLDGLVLDIYGSALTIKGGEVVMTGGQISSYDSPAILMDYGALAKFDMQGGRISSYGADSAVRVKLGSAIIRGGRIDTEEGCAIRSDGSLILSGSPKIVGGETDIITTRPITLTYAETTFSGGLTVKYNADFLYGKLTPVFHCATDEAMEHIRLYDAADVQMPIRFFDSHSSREEKNFGAVYLPFTVDFHGTGGIIYRREVLHGECVTPENPPERAGYEFIGWRASEGEKLYDFDTQISSNLSLHAYYKLIPPTFTLSPLEFYFDGDEHKLELSNLSHPLISEATVSYTWLCRGQELSYKESSVSLKCVADSGDYQCKITMTVGSDTVSAISEPISVKVKRAPIDVPVIVSKEYNGEYQSPDISSTSIYEVSACEGREAGVYFVTLTLSDPGNYEFTGNRASVVVDFEIKPRAITLKLSDSNKYLFSSPTAPTYNIVNGDIIEGDELNLAFIYEDGKVGCQTENRNYILTVIEGRILEHATLKEQDLFVLFATFLIFLTVILILSVLIWRRREIRHYFSVIRCKLAPVSRFQTENTEKPLPKAAPEAENPPAECGMGVDVARAEELISNSMAKSLVRRGREVVETDGNKKSIINVDTLSAGFCAGDTVDVNKLKSMNLVPYDTAYIKVLARGIIDKPLKVYANDFSLCAVKMLALSGGEAVRVITVAKKSEKKRARENKIN